MASITVDDRELRVTLTWQEKMAGLQGDVRLPLDAIRSVEVEPDPLGAARGVRAPGLAIPAVVKIGTWRGRGRQLVVARRGMPAVRIGVSGEGFDEVVVSTPRAEAVALEIQERAGLDNEGPGVRAVDKNRT